MGKKEERRQQKITRRREGQAKRQRKRDANKAGRDAKQQERKANRSRKQQKRKQALKDLGNGIVSVAKFAGRAANEIITLPRHAIDTGSDTVKFTVGRTADVLSNPVFLIGAAVVAMTALNSR